MLLHTLSAFVLEQTFCDAGKFGANTSEMTCWDAPEPKVFATVLQGKRVQRLRLLAL